MSVGNALFAGTGVATHVRTALYFASFLGCLLDALRQFPWRKSAVMAVPYSLTALVCTWRLILIFFVEHTQRYADHDDPPNLFIEAYVLVCDTPAGWWWSNVLLLWVTVACPMAHAEATRRGMSAALVLTYVVVAFLGAVSLAFPLLLAHLLTMPTNSTRPTTAITKSTVWWVWPACAGASLLSIGALPWSVDASRPIFILALTIVHIVLALPFMHAATSPMKPPALLDGAGYRHLAVVAAALHLSATAAATGEVASADGYTGFGGFVSAFTSHLVNATMRNVCQASISIDAVLSSVAGSAFMVGSAERADRLHALGCCAASVLVGPAAGLAVLCAHREDKVRAQKQDQAAPASAAAERPGAGSAAPADARCSE